MGSWSTTAPSGVSWSGYSTSNANSSNNYNLFRTSARIARGAGDTIYVHVRIQLYGKTYGVAGSTPLKAQVYVGAGGYESSATYSLTGDYGGWTTKKNLYYTGTAAAGVTVGARTAWNTNYAGPVNFSAPAYTTTYAITYSGNGADSGSVASQTKTYNTAITLQQNGYTREGYAFTGWNTAADGSGTAYAAGASYTANAAVTLYAQWVRTNIPVYVNVNGTIHQVERAYMNIGGTVKEVDVYLNVGGVIKTIR